MTEKLLEENRRLAQRCIELEGAARREVEKLRAANASLSRGAADLSVVLENAAIGFALVDLNLHIASANHTLAAMLGYAGAELPGIIFSNFVYVGKLPAFTRLVVRNEKNARSDEIIELLARDGSLVPCRIEASDWLDDGGVRQGHVFLIFDAGAEVGASRRLRETEQALAEADWSRRLFLEVLAEEALSAAEIADAAGTLLAAGIDATPVSSSVVTADFADGTLRLFARRAEEKGLDLRAHIGPGVPETLVLDARALRCVLAHLLDNALKYTGRGHVALSIDAIGGEGARFVRFMVSDTGSGLDAVAQEELFRNMLAPESPSAPRPQGGLGVGAELTVGLAICRRLVAGMGGRLAFESIPGGGSEFHILLPLAQ